MRRLTKRQRWMIVLGVAATHAERELLAVDICSLSLLPFMSLAEPQSYPGIRNDFERSFETLRSLPADIFLASHGKLKAVTPDSLQYLLHALFEVNTFWTFDTKDAKAEQTDVGAWRVTLDVDARKVVVDSAGVPTTLPMDELVEIGIYAPAEQGETLGKPLYVQKHRIRSGRQTIMVTLPQKPARAGIDPYNLLDWEQGDNIEPLKIEARRAR